MKLGGGPALAADHEEFAKGLRETIFSFFPILLDVSTIRRDQKEFHEVWMDDKPAKEFLDALKQLCKSESMRDTNLGLSTCFEKLLSLLDYIRPQHFVVGVKKGYSLGDIVSVDTTFTVKNNTEITA